MFGEKKYVTDKESVQGKKREVHQCLFSNFLLVNLFLKSLNQIWSNGVKK
jgi:hypothetical protein